MTTRETAESEPADQVVTITDPRAIRALAHPARLAIIEALYDGPGLTATECARLTGQTPSATSYHLRALAKWGLVTRAPETGDGRERPWRAAGSTLAIRPANAMASAAANTALFDTMLGQVREAYLANLRVRDEAGSGRASLISDRLELTEAEEAELITGLHALIAPYVHRTSPVGARPVRLLAAVLPELRGETGAEPGAEPSPRARAGGRRRTGSPQTKRES